MPWPYARRTLTRSLAGVSVTAGESESPVPIPIWQTLRTPSTPRRTTPVTPSPSSATASARRPGRAAPAGSRAHERRNEQRCGTSSTLPRRGVPPGGYPPKRARARGTPVTTLRRARVLVFVGVGAWTQGIVCCFARVPFATIPPLGEPRARVTRPASGVTERVGGLVVFVFLGSPFSRFCGECCVRLFRACLRVGCRLFVFRAGPSLGSPFAGPSLWSHEPKYATALRTSLGSLLAGPSCGLCDLKERLRDKDGASVLPRSAFGLLLVGRLLGDQGDAVVDFLQPYPRGQDAFARVRPRFRIGGVAG